MIVYNIIKHGAEIKERAYIFTSPDGKISGIQFPRETFSNRFWIDIHGLHESNLKLLIKAYDKAREEFKVPDILDIDFSRVWSDV